MHVGDAVAVGKLQCRVLFEERNHVRASFEEGVDAFGVVIRPQFIAQVGTRLLDVFLDTGPARQRVARHPGPAAGPGGGAAEHRRLLDQHHALPVPGSRYRRSQAGCA
ncbi:hypothetical protein D3C75_1216400 [compost metagenome]